MTRFSLPGTRSISTREFSRNPSKALRDSLSTPMLVMKYHRPVACLVSVEHWSQVMERLRTFVEVVEIDEADVPAIGANLPSAR